MTTQTIAPAPTWDLDAIFPGGAGSSQFKTHRDKVKTELADARLKLSELPDTLSDSTQQAWVDFILRMQSLVENIELVISFAHCLVSQDVSDSVASGIESEGIEQLSDWMVLRTDFEARSLKQSDAAWDALLASPDIKPIKFFLNHGRELARKKMSSDMESLALDLAVNGYHAWNLLYDKMAGDLRVHFQENGQAKELSLGQLNTRMSSPDRAVRRQAFEKLTQAWESREDLAAMALNSQAGFRLSLYKRRGWESPQFEPLHMSKMSRQSLDAMWSVISRETPRLKKYIDAKMALLGIDKFRWYDEFAPCGSVERMYPYDEAADFIVKNVAGFSGDMATFYRHAVDKRWIEAEDRSGKAGGGYCTGMGPFRQSRIFMTYAGSYENLLTLAHELGHAYHSYVLRDKPFFATEYPMTLAETASIFSELLVTDAAMKECDDPREKLMLIDQKLQQPFIFFCDIHTRYLFDSWFYEERKNGVVGKERLRELMVKAQKQAFGPLLDESGHHPLFWASKLHFYITDAPFYNYPYTVGFLFAGGVYDRARKEGSAFADKYRALLADTGSMTTEDVAMKHLGADLTKEDFWNDAVNRSLADVDEFVKLAREVGK